MRLSDRLLLIACGALVLAGPVMAVQEYVKGRQALGVEVVTGERAAVGDTGFRATWRVVLLALVLAVGVFGSLQVLRVARAPRVRGVSRRLVALLLAGMVLLDLAFLLDRAAAEAAYLVRAVSVVWAYPLAAVVVALSSARLSELEAAFAQRPREAQ